MNDHNNKISRDPENVSSLRRSLYKYMRPDLTSVEREMIENLVNLILDISEKEFQCRTCHDNHSMFAYEVKKMVW